MDGPPRLPTWPIRYRTLPSRTLACLMPEGYLLDEAGEVHEGSDWAAIREWCSGHHGVLLVRSLALAPWLRDAVADPRASVSWSDRAERVMSVRIRDRDGSTSWVLDAATSWGVTAEPASMALIRSVWTAGEVGDHVTAGAWGSAIASATWPQGQRRIANLAANIAHLMRRTAVGGRCETPDVGRMLATAMEYDVNSAYASEVGSLPDGAPVWLVGDPATSGMDMATGYYYCEWIARPLSGEPIALSPLFADDEAPDDWQARRRGHWTPSSGMHTGWYWAHEIDAAARVGIEVYPLYGFAWPAMTDAMQPWLDRMIGLRHQVGPDAAPLVKLATVATIGRWAARPEASELSLAAEGDSVAIEATPTLPALTVRHVSAIRPGLIPHWTSHVMASSRLRVWTAALAAQAQGVYAAHDYDSVVTSGPVEGIDIGAAPGQWKVRELHDVVLVAARSMVSREKVRLPGQTGAARQHAISVARPPV